jgi:hypothetical protein
MAKNDIGQEHTRLTYPGITAEFAAIAPVSSGNTV